MLPLSHFDELQAALSAQDDPASARLKLEQSRSQFLDLLAFPGPNAKEKASLDSGHYEGYTISSEFKQEALFLSSQLQLSEFYCSALLVEAGKSSMASRGSAEVAVLVFYEMRSALLASLVLLIQKAQDPTTDYAFKQVLVSFLSELMAADFQSKILKEIDRLQQLAQSITSQPATVPAGSTSASFAPDIQKHRLACLQDERNALGVVLYVLATGGFLKPKLILEMAQWLAAKPNTADPATLHVLIASLASLDPTRETEAEVPVLNDVFYQPDLCKHLHGQISDKKWGCEPMRALLLLQWTLFFSHACQSNVNLEQDTQIWEEAIEKDVYTALKLDALSFLLDPILAFRTGDAVSTFSADFRPQVLAQIEVLTDTFISTMHQVLKKLKNKEEDRRLGSYRTGRRGEEEASAPARHDIATLFKVIQVLYKDRPDAALKFWLETEEGDRRLNAFLRWASDSKGNMATAFFDMLASLSCGEGSSSYAHQLLSANSSSDGTVTNLCSWSTLFGAVNYYAGLFQAGNQGQEIPPEEVDSLRSLAHLLTGIVSWSAAARAVLIDNQSYRPIQSIFSLVIHPIRLDLKGDLLNAIAAFSVPDDNPALAADIAKRCWTVLEQSQILPTWSQAANGRIEGGIVTELETVETPGEQYPTTTAFLHLLASLIHKQPSGADSLFVGPTLTFPDNLGAPHRKPGLGPYVGFVVDTVFLRLKQRKYTTESEHWQVAENCLVFIDNALSNVQLQPILARPSMAALQVLLQQPGIDLLGRFLRSGPLLASVAGVASTPLDELTADGCPARKTRSVELGLRILLHLYRLGPMFGELVVPWLAEQERLPFERSALVQGLQTLDDAILQMPGVINVVPRLATLVNCSTSTELPRLAIELLTVLSLSRGFSVVDAHSVSGLQSSRINRLVGFLSESDESERIAIGFTRQLREADEPTRAAILELLTSNLAQKASSPTIAHWLLGFSYRQEALQGVSIELNGGRSSLTAIVDIIESNSSPAAVEHAYRIIHQLCSQDFTAQPATRFLRTESDFFVKGIASLPFGLASASQADTALLLHAQAWLLKAVALEINELVNEQQTDRITRLLVGLLNVRDREDEGDAMQSEQSLSCMLELLHALSSDDTEDVAAIDLTGLTFFPSLNLQSCLDAVASGIPIYSLERVQAVVQQRLRDLQGQGQLKVVDQQNIFRSEAQAIVDYVTGENVRTKLQAARYHFLQSWNGVLDIILVKAISYFAPADRYTLLLDLLETIVALLDAKYFVNEQADCLSSAAVMLVTCLREEQIAQGLPGPLDRLPPIFKTTIRALLTPGVGSICRGQLFCVLSQFLRISSAGAAEPASKFASALAADLGRLLQLACRDALFADDVWQLLAFSFLDSLCSIASPHIPATKLLAGFAKHNFVHNVVVSLKHGENDLVACMNPEPDSLNALFVYEAKMSFLIRIAATKDGADAITDAQTLAKLGQCEFLNAPLYEDQTMATDCDAFFPSIYARYQQILLPTLQLLVAYASHLTAKHAQDRKRELFAFILSHKDAFVSVLHQIVSAPTLKLLEQACMILQLLALTGPLATNDEFASPSSFGGIHSAVLTMTATALEQTSLDAIVPATEQEEIAAADRAPGEASAFEVTRRAATFDLIHGLLAYLYTMSNSSRPVLTSDAQEHAQSIGRYPSLATCLSFIRKQTHLLIRGITTSGRSAALETPLQVLEVSLLLFLRHLQFYFEGNQRATAQSKASIQQSFNAVAARLQEVELDGPDARAHELLLKQAVRCCGEALRS